MNDNREKLVAKLHLEQESTRFAKTQNELAEGGHDAAFAYLPRFSHRQKKTRLPPTCIQLPGLSYLTASEKNSLERLNSGNQESS